MRNIKIERNGLIIYHDCDSVPTNFYKKIDRIIEKIPRDFSKCYIGHSPDDNTCNIIPNYNYSRLDKYRINEYIYKCPIKPKNVFAYILNPGNPGNPKDNIDITGIYMTIPLLYNKCSKCNENPFENIWNKYPKEEEYVLTLLQEFGNLLENNGIGYSLEGGSLLGYAREEKLIPYDDDLDIIVDRNDIPKIEFLLKDIDKKYSVYRYKNKLNNGLYAKIYNLYGKTIENYSYKWPFIDIFIFDKSLDGIFLPERKKTVNIFPDYINVELTSHNSGKTYKTSVFRDYSKLLDTLFPNWRNVCTSSDRNHRNETEKRYIYSFNCKNVLSDYKLIQENYQDYYSVIDRYGDYRKKLLFIILVALSLYYVFIIFILLKTKNS